MTPLLKIVPAIPLCFAAQVAYGADFSYIRGIGATTCTDYIRWREQGNETQAALISWIYGFWSGLNMSDPASSRSNLFSDLATPQAVEAEVLASCYRNSSARLIEIAVKIYFELPNG